MTETIDTTDSATQWISPSLWLLGATREAGVSTLEQFWSFTADSEGSWPPGDDRERVSPYVVIVARDSFKSLTAAQISRSHTSEERSGPDRSSSG
ncbi:hypothetical protein A3Q41_04913 (plasmid) [Rhodococcoides fascians]|uniref:Uncharacterized protein n=1 Tax=Rhodococcoides fascians TaxID=1828 RepID=A0A143QTN0_RHOFA|nr:hypothetical protein [Rhodococcus fascians]AMY26168.1 hypothetical protein A3Q41_04913 [Rhodococcus fascians]